MADKMLVRWFVITVYAGLLLCASRMQAYALAPGSGFEEAAAERLAQDMRESLTAAEPVNALGRLFEATMQAGHAYRIPEAYHVLQDTLPYQEQLLLGRVTFEAFAGESIEEFVKHYGRRGVADPASQVSPVQAPFKILTLTPNPAFNVAFDFSKFSRMAPAPEETIQIDVGGVGLIVASAMAAWGVPSRSFAYTGGQTGEMVKAYMQRQGVDTSSFTQVDGSNRINMLVHVAHKGQAHTRMKGPVIAPQREAELDAALWGIAESGDLLIMGGSLSEGQAPDFYADHIRKAQARGVKTFLDTRGEALKRGIDAGPTFLSINTGFFASYLEIPNEDLREDPALVAEHAAALLRRLEHTETIIITMAAEGMVMVTEEGAWHAKAPPVEVVSQEGGGDTVHVAFAYAHTQGWDKWEALKLAAAASTITVTKPGLQLAGLAESLPLKEQITVVTLHAPRAVGPRDRASTRLDSMVDSFMQDDLGDLDPALWEDDEAGEPVMLSAAQFAELEPLAQRIWTFMERAYPEDYREDALHYLHSIPVEFMGGHLREGGPVFSFGNPIFNALGRDVTKLTDFLRTFDMLTRQWARLPLGDPLFKMFAADLRDRAQETSIRGFIAFIQELGAMPGEEDFADDPDLAGVTEEEVEIAFFLRGLNKMIEEPSGRIGSRSGDELAEGVFGEGPMAFKDPMELDAFARANRPLAYALAGVEISNLLFSLAVEFETFMKDGGGDWHTMEEIQARARFLKSRFVVHTAAWLAESDRGTGIDLRDPAVARRVNTLLPWDPIVGKIRADVAVMEALAARVRLGWTELREMFPGAAVYPLFSLAPFVHDPQDILRLREFVKGWGERHLLDWRGSWAQIAFTYGFARPQGGIDLTVLRELTMGQHL